MMRKDDLAEERGDSRRRWLMYAAIAALILCMAAAAGLSWWQGAQVHRLESESDSRAKRLEHVEGDSKDLSKALTEQRAQFERCKNKKAKTSPECREAVSDSPGQITGSAGPSGGRGAAGAPGRDSIVPGPAGKAGRDGRDSTVPGPRGDKGDTGQDGRSVKGDKGDSGESVKGEKGDPGESVTGPKGDPGSDGKDGRDGRGIDSITCGSDDNWIVRYSDGSESTITGPCRVPTPAPNPSPDPTDPD